MKKFNAYSIVVAFMYLFSFVQPTALFAAGPTTVNLLTASNFAILAKTGVSTTGSTLVTGNIGLSPAPASYITGFGLILPVAGSFSTSALVSGSIYAPDYANSTPTNMTTAVLDMQNAYTDGAGRAPTVSELGAGNIGGLTLVPGVYKWGTGVSIGTDMTLSGGANDVWIFVIAQNLVVSSGVKIILSGGARPSNIFWVVAGQTTVGTTAVFNGNILDQTTIVLNTGAVLNGRALAQAAVTLDSNAVTVPSTADITNMTNVPPATNPTPSPVTNYQSSTNYQSTNTPTTYTTNTTYSSNTLIPTVNQPYSAPVRTIGVDLREGTSGTHVEILQQFLISQNKGTSARALTNVGATAYFGPLTRAALAEFQAYAGINPSSGNFGPITREYVNTHY